MWDALLLFCIYRSNYGDLEVSVAVTPNGYADAVDAGRFMLPEERKMTFSQFLGILDKPDSVNGIFYIQKQNSNMTEEFSSLLQDIQSDLPWATEAFGKKCHCLFRFIFQIRLRPSLSDRPN